MSLPRKQWLVAVAIVAASLGLTAAPASACSCAPGSDVEHFERADAVFADVIAMPLLADSDPPDDDTEPDPESGGIVLVVGFLLVGAGAAVVAARLAKKSREE